MLDTKIGCSVREVRYENISGLYDNSTGLTGLVDFVKVTIIITIVSMVIFTKPVNPVELS